MRRPRRLRPGAWWFITARCARAQHRLRPDLRRRNAVGFWLARALASCPGVRLHAFVQMSNHLHAVIEDRYGRLDRFMARVLGPLAKYLNRLDETTGQVWERRYSAIEILDEDALRERIAYTVLNPVTAGLVARPEEWGGVLLWASGRRSARFERFHQRRYDMALNRARGDRSLVERAAYTEVVTLEVFIESDEETASTARVIQATLRARTKARRGRPVLGMGAVLRLGAFDAPDAPKRSPMPLCHASCAEDFLAYRVGWRAWLERFRAASAAFRAGALDVLFPEHAFRPWVPIL